MDSKNYIDLVSRFLNRELSSEEQGRFLLWCKDERNDKVVRQLMWEYWNTVDPVSNKMVDEIDYKKSWEGIMNELNIQHPRHSAPHKASVFKRNLFSTYKVAASLLLFIMAGFLVYFYLQNSSGNTTESPHVKIVERATKERQRSTLTLRDGTKVVLNSNSSLRYPEFFDGDKRVVELDGEAYFEVAEDINKAFVVKSQNLFITALGTSFNIKQDENNANVIVSLTSGKVAVSYDKASAAITSEGVEILSPGQEVICLLEGKEMNRRPFNINAVTAWKDGVLVFDEMDIFEIKSSLEKWYGVEIKLVNPPSLDWKYTGEFTNESLRNVLDGLSFSKKLKYTIKDELVILNFTD